jgi:hypothetical protein
MINNPEYQAMSDKDKIAALEAQNQRLSEALVKAMESMCHWMQVAKEAKEEQK